MKLTQKLLGLLNSVFDKDPLPFMALRLTYAGSMSWAIADEVMTTTVVGGPGHALTIDLTQYTVRSLVSYLAGQAGYTVLFMDSGRADLSARVLLDGGANQADSNGDHIYGYTSLLWAWVESVAVELTVAEAQVAASPKQMNAVDGEGMWLDEIGSYYDVPRIAGELDPQYGPRIIAEALRPRSNNIALENAIAVYTGQTAQVVDVTIYGSAAPLYNGAISYDGSHTHSGGTGPLYGLFDVNYAFDLLGGADPISFATTIRAIIERLRAAGTHLRALALQTSTISDSFTPPTDSSSVISVGSLLADTLTGPTESIGLIYAALGALMDTLTAPADTAGLGLSVSYAYTYSGLRSYGGVAHYNSGSTLSETI